MMLQNFLIRSNAFLVLLAPCLTQLEVAVSQVLNCGHWIFRHRPSCEESPPKCSTRQFPSSNAGELHPSIHPSIHPSMHACMHACIHTHIHTYIYNCDHQHIRRNSKHAALLLASGTELIMQACSPRVNYNRNNDHNHSHSGNHDNNIA